MTREIITLRAREVILARLARLTSLIYTLTPFSKSLQKIALQLPVKKLHTFS